jgi:soluble lytic murein transglycosylase-like protein
VVAVSVLLAVLLLGSSGTTLPESLTGETIQEAEPIFNSTETSTLAIFFTPEVQRWSESIQNWAIAMNLDPNLAATAMQVESCGNPFALSPAGAMGLFQVMPYHFTANDNPYDPDTNARRGLEYLRQALDASDGEARLAFAGYNGGIGVISRSEFSWAGETQRYAYWASGIYADAARGASESPRLQEWLEAGGTSLCRQARQRLGIDQ